AILISPNMSVATNVAFELLATMAKALGDEYDVEITEIHHRFKKDAPSGTALRMAEVVAAGPGRHLDQVSVYGRQGLPGERPKREIGILSLRSGDVVGEHTVSFGTLGDRLELVHKAHNPAPTRGGRASSWATSPITAPPPRGAPCARRASSPGVRRVSIRWQTSSASREGV